MASGDGAKCKQGMAGCLLRIDGARFARDLSRYRYSMVGRCLSTARSSAHQTERVGQRPSIWQFLNRVLPERTFADLFDNAV